MLRPLTFIAILAIAAPQPSPAGDMIDFTLPWDDASPGITDFSDLNDAPAGSQGHIVADADGHFSVGGKRIRLMGVNITAASCFPTHEEAEKIAARLAKFGFNIVRFHHMDNHWGGASLIDYAKGNSRSLHAGNLEKLDYFVAQLKARGIYANLNLINSRDFLTADGLDPAAAPLDLKIRHTLGFVDPVVRNLEKEYATQLVGHLNPYTGLTYAEDPAIAVVEINNENGIFQQWLSGYIDLWPAKYEGLLADKWNAWLADKYESTAALLDAWSGESVPLGAQLIENPTFTGSLAPWNLEQHQGAVASATLGSYDSRQGVRIRVTTAGSAAWHVQFNQAGRTFVKDQLYTLSLWIKSDTSTPVDIAIGQAYDPWQTIHGFPGVTTSTTWEKKTFLFYAGVSDTNLRLNFGGFGAALATIYLSDVTIHEGGSLAAELPDGESLEAGNLSVNRRNESYLQNRTLDWTRFLHEIELEYWTAMYSYIKDTIGYRGLVNGTIIANSPPNVQAALDFVDTHAYWQHPVFPGTAWDPNNWYVNRVSIVNTLSSTIADLARQRVKGKPHTVSEYRHSYPNVYAAEGPLLIAAYGALQDWDGIYFFDYAKGQSWNQGYVDNYFNMNAHPTDMANSAVAAAIFRYGLVEPAPSELVMNFNAETEIDTLANRGTAWNVANGTHLGIQPAHAILQRVALAVDGDDSGLDGEPPAPPSAGPVFTATGSELSWDLSVANKGVVTIDTDHAKAIVGFPNGRTFSLGGIDIQFGNTIEEWATLALLAREGDFERPQLGGRYLLVATGVAENTGMQWTDSTKTSVGTNWGQAPTRIESIPATITIPLPAASVKAWALDGTGQRGAALAVTDLGNTCSVTLGASGARSLWYEIEVTATNTPYGLWSESQFNETELLDPNVSGPQADPDKDGVANLLEFLLGLSPKSHDARDPIKTSIAWSNGKPCFTFVFNLATDFPGENVDLATSANLTNWIGFTGDDAEIAVSVEQLSDTLERITVTYCPTEYPAFSRLRAK